MITRFIHCRTNKSSRLFFPEKKIFPLHLNSHKYPKKYLHLDCCLQIVGSNKAIIHPDAFTYKDYLMLVELFGKKNILKSTTKMCKMTSNVLSIDQKQ